MWLGRRRSGGQVRVGGERGVQSSDWLVGSLIAKREVCVCVSVSVSVSVSVCFLFFEVDLFIAPPPPPSSLPLCFHIGLQMFVGGGVLINAGFQYIS